MQGVLVQLAHCCAVRGLDVVGIDFQFRFGVDLRPGLQQQMREALLGIGLLRVFGHQHAAVEYRFGLSIQHTAPGLTSGGLGFQVLNAGLVVEVAARGQRIGTRQVRFGAGAL